MRGELCCSCSLGQRACLFLAFCVEKKQHHGQETLAFYPSAFLHIKPGVGAELGPTVFLK